MLARVVSVWQQDMRSRMRETSLRRARWDGHRNGGTSADCREATRWTKVGNDRPLATQRDRGRAKRAPKLSCWPLQGRYMWRENERLSPSAGHNSRRRNVGVGASPQLLARVPPASPSLGIPRVSPCTQQHGGVRRRSQTLWRIRVGTAVHWRG